MSFVHSFLLVATMTLTKPVLSGCTFKDHGLGGFTTAEFKCQSSTHVLGWYCQKESTYQRDNCNVWKTRWWNAPKCSSGHQEIKSESCGWHSWPRTKITCRKPMVADYGCGCGKSPQSCQCQCDNEVKRCPDGYTLQKNTDYHGNDIKCGEKLSAGQAATKCNDNSDCVGFSLSRFGAASDPYTPWCLKSKLANKGTKDNHHFCVKNVNDVNGKNVSSGAAVSHTRSGKCFSNGYKGQFLGGCVEGDNCKEYTTKLDAIKACLKAGSKCGGLNKRAENFYEIREGDKLLLRANGQPTHETAFVKGRCETQENCYIGCFVDDKNRDMGKFYKDFAGGHSVESCRVKCAGYKYFSIQNGSECFCANSYGNGPQYKQVDESQCRKNGEGHGGYMRQSIYHVQCSGCQESLHKNMDVVSGRFKRVPDVSQPAQTRSDEECAELCRSTESCEYFVRLPSTGQCYRGMGLDESVTTEKQNDRNLGYVCRVNNSRRLETAGSDVESVSFLATEAMEALQSGEIWLALDNDDDEEVAPAEEEEEEPETGLDAPPSADDGGSAPLPGDAPVPLAETVSHIENMDQFCKFAQGEGMMDASCAAINALLSDFLPSGILDVCNGTDMLVGDICQ